MRRNTTSAPFEVTGDGAGLAGRSGLGLVAELADRSGLTHELSHAVGGVRRWTQHDPGKVLRDVAITLVDDGDALRHMGVVAAEPEVFGDVGSAATVCRTVSAVDDEDEALARRLDDRGVTAAPRRQRPPNLPQPPAEASNPASPDPTAPGYALTAPAHEMP